MSTGWKRTWVALTLLALLGCERLGPPKPKATAAPPPPVAVNTPAAVTTDTSGPSATPAVTGSPSSSGTPVASAGKPLTETLEPLDDKTGRFPVITRKETIKMSTSQGEVVIEIYPEAAPNACQRFKELVEKGFYDDTPFSRVVKRPAPFVAQFGINWRPGHKDWENKHFKDDPSYFKLDRGTLAFAKGEKDTNSTQVFINYRDNSKLANPEQNFTAFGRVVKGMEIIDALPVVGDEAAGLDQYRLWMDGERYLDTLTTKPAMIEKMTLVKP